jgi:phosphoribosylamine-glycine ligase
LQKKSFFILKIKAFIILVFAYKVLRTIVFYIKTSSNRRTLRTLGGQVFAVSAIAETLKQAVKAVYERVKAVSFQNVYFRTDIAKQYVFYDSKPWFSISS